MPTSYELYVRHEIYYLLREIPRSSRDRILTFVDSITADPFQSGDYAEPDATGRRCQVRIIGKYAIYFWVDHAVKEIRIIDLIDADQE